MTTNTTIADVASKINGVTNRGAWNTKPTTIGKITIPAGYHNGSGYVDTGNLGTLSNAYVYQYTNGFSVTGSGTSTVFTADRKYSALIKFTISTWTNASSASCILKWFKSDGTLKQTLFDKGMTKTPYNYTTEQIVMEIGDYITSTCVYSGNTQYKYVDTGVVASCVYFN